MSTKEQMREWYKKNRKRKLAYQKKYHQRTGYASDKRTERREINNLRRKTRYRYSLVNKKCLICGKTAEERHHTTKPYLEDKIVFLCKEHHLEIHQKMRDKK